MSLLKLRKLRKNRGFTLLEIIIVIIIIGVLASLALPRLFSTIEYSRGTEALASIGSIRRSLESYYLQKASYNTVTLAMLDLTDPGTSPGAHFSYAINGPTGTGYRVTATRIALDGGTTTDLIEVTQTATTITRHGTTAFAGIQ